MRKTSAALVTALAIAMSAAPVVAQDADSAEIDEVRAVTATYSWLPNALDAGYVPLTGEDPDVPLCVDSDAGGMGLHYLRNVDGVADATDPEAIMYSVAEDGSTTLVAVEYVVPQPFVEDEDGNVVALPSVLGQDLQLNPDLGLYTLHAWIWEENPDGMFADFNPAVAPCPTA
ncbi:MAG: hypothetical protein ACC726_15660 [Chloroflexota bacterium]